MVESLVRWLLRNRITVLSLAIILGGVGIWAYRSLPVDALPDISENQVIVSVDWPGTSPVDVEDQVTYPLSSSLQGLPGTRQVRSISAFGFAQVYVVFDDGVDLYWARDRVSARLDQVAGELPDGAVLRMGPDATPLGQIYWYVLEGPYDLGTMRTLQDYVIRPALQSVSGVSEVSSVGGFQREYAVEADPDQLLQMGISLIQVHQALAASNSDVGAGTVEESGMEYIVRGMARLRDTEDIESVLVAYRDSVPVTVGDIATVFLAPGFRRGALADDTGELAGGIVVMRQGEDPVRVIEAVEERISRLEPVLPAGVELKAYYDRRQLIAETTSTLTGAISTEMLVTLLVIMLFLVHVRSSLIVASTLPYAVLLSFIGMRLVGVGANIMSFAGIAIAVGTLVDMGIVVTESIHQKHAEGGGRKGIPGAVAMVAPALLTSLATTVISFVPVFFLTGQSGRLFIPLAWTKTLALTSAGIVAVILVPVLASLAMARSGGSGRKGRILLASIGLGLLASWAVSNPASAGWMHPVRPWVTSVIAGLLVAGLVYRAAVESLKSPARERISAALSTGYLKVLDLVVSHRKTFAVAALLVILLGGITAVGAGRVLSLLEGVGLEPSRFRPAAFLEEAFPGLGTQFMPPLDEGSFLFMPSLLSQASLNETVDVMVAQNRAMAMIPEVDMVVGKAGRADSPLDPAPPGMIETVITLDPRDTWRDGVTADSVLQELRESVRMPGIAPSWLQPIETRIVMLQSGIRTNIGLEVHGSEVDEIERVTVALEEFLRSVPGATDVSALRMGRRPYVQVSVDREAAAAYGISVQAAQRALSGSMAGMVATEVLDGRERIPVRVRYARTHRNDLADIPDIYVQAPGGAGVLLSVVASIETVLGPATIRSVDGELVGYVMLNAQGRDQGGLVEEADRLLEEVIRADAELPPEERQIDLPEGYYFEWVGSYRSQIEAQKRFGLLIPLCLGSIFLLMYLQFRRLSVPFFIFFGSVPLAVAGGVLFIALWPQLHSLLWSLGLMGVPPVGSVHVTVAVVVGFIALLGICVDDGVLMATYISQLHRSRKPSTKREVRELVRIAGARRIRPAVMTTVTTLVALVPVILSSGRGSDLARPMALPVFGGMIAEFAAMLVVPVLYGWWLERGLPENLPGERSSAPIARDVPVR